MQMVNVGLQRLAEILRALPAASESGNVHLHTSASMLRRLLTNLNKDSNSTRCSAADVYVFREDHHNGQQPIRRQSTP